MLSLVIVGPGERGRGVMDLKSSKEEYKKEGFNIRASDSIALDRSLMDMRSHA